MRDGGCVDTRLQRDSGGRGTIGQCRGDEAAFYRVTKQKRGSVRGWRGGRDMATNALRLI